MLTEPILRHAIRALWISLFISLLSPALSGQEPVTDFDGNTYETVLIGDQLWMAENLRSIHDAGGAQIKRVCYELIRENCDEYGGLYAWDDLKIDEKNKNYQGICPDGWHVPSDLEWTSFIDAIGGADSAAYKLNRGMVNNVRIQYGGNYHNRLRNFNYQGDNAYYWTSDSFSSTAAFIWMIGKKNINANRSSIPKLYCISVRCVKD